MIETTRKVREILLKNSLFGDKMPNDSSDFIAEAFLDSLQYVQFISDIEEQFQIQLSEEELSSAKMTTIQGVSELLDARSFKNTQL